jgi:HEAT repeats
MIRTSVTSVRHRFSMVQMCAAMLFAFLIGATLSWVFLHEGASQRNEAPTTTAQSATPPGPVILPRPEPDALSTARADAPAKQPAAEVAHPHGTDLNSLLAKLVARPDTSEPRDPMSQALDLLKSDPKARAQLIARFQSEPDPQARLRLRTLLAFVRTDDVAQFALRMASDPDVRSRQDGFQLLAGVQLTSASAREVLLNALRNEQLPEAQSAAIVSLQPGASPSPQETAEITKELSKFLQHSSPELRAESLLALVRWQRGNASEDPIYRGLTDQDASVREAAMTAIVESAVQSDRLKTTLLDLARDQSARASNRIMAVEALNRFNLTAEDHASVDKLRETMPSWN